ncbi:MAG TPA: hypothetical protein VIW80_22385 [Pyrinomonadaceae bacterium]
MTRKIIEITVETERLLIFHRQFRMWRAWCVSCACDVEMVSPVEAASLAGVSPSIIHQRAQAGKLHSGCTAEGEVFICLKSLCEAEHAGL